MLTLHHEFPNQLYGHASVNARSVECDWHEFDSHVTARTRLVAMSTVNYTTGLRPDLDELVKDLRGRGIVVYLDGTQSCGALQFDCAAVAPDFFAVDAYKWMISPNGATFIYVNPEMRRRLPPNVLGWRSDKDWRNVTHLHHGAPRFGESAEKYEPGMMAFASLYGMDASLRLIEEIGITQIEKRVLELADTLRAELAGMGAEFFRSKGDCLAFADCDRKFAGRRFGDAGQEVGGTEHQHLRSPRLFTHLAALLQQRGRSSRSSGRHSQVTLLDMWLRAAFVLGGIALTTWASAPVGIPRELAEERAAAVSNLRYELSFEIRPHADSAPGQKHCASS